MDESKLKALGDAIGMTLYKRDNDKLINETIEHVAERLAKKETATRNTGVISEAEAMERFYQNTNRKD